MIRFHAPLLALCLVFAACGVEPVPADPDVNLEPIPEEPAPEPEPPQPEEEKPVESLCGNDVLDDDELCDSGELGGLTCQHLGFGGGDLGCNDACTDLQPNACAPLVATPIAPLGESVFSGGDFDAVDPTWVRPDASCGVGAAGGHAFDAYAYVNQTGAPQRVNFTAVWGEGNDGFLHAFSSGADLRFVDDCEQGNDDHEGTSGSRLSVDLAAGARIVIVASTYAPAAAFGPYTLEAETVALDEEAPIVDPAEAQVLPIGLPGQSLLVDGNITSADSAFTRAGAACEAELGAAVNYERVQVVNETGADQRINLRAAFLDGGAGIVHVYRGFDAAAPLASCEAELLEVAIAADEVLDVVVSSVGAPAGAWTLEVETIAPLQDDEVLTPVSDVGGVVMLSGDLAGAATWDRVSQSCQPTALGGQAFVAHRIVNETGGHQHLRITASWDGDGFLALFSEDFVAGEPGASCLAADDDWSANDLPGSTTLGSRITDVRIGAGDVLVVVASGFSASTTLGEYDIEVATEGHDGPEALEMADNLGTLETGGLIQAGSLVLLEEGGDARLYSAHLMQNHGDHEHGLELTATWADGEDGVLRVYAFDADAPGGLGALLASNDDFEGTQQSFISGEELRILDDAPFVVVATGFQASAAIGAYKLTATTTE